jgi:HEPN domain-containing protein
VRLLPPSIPQPPEIAASIQLTGYALETRYPGRQALVTEEEYREALRLAEAVVRWATEVIGE